MPRSNIHIIQKQLLDLNIQTREDGFALQQRLSEFCREKLFPAMQELLDRLVGAEELIRIEKLELDLGGLDLENLEEQFLKKILTALEEEVTNLKQDSGSGEGAVRIPIHYSDFEGWLFFLEKGYLTWRQENTAEAERQRGVLKTLATEKEATLKLQQTLEKSIHNLDRLVLQHSEIFLAQLLEAFSGLRPERIHRLEKQIIQLSQAIKGASFPDSLKIDHPSISQNKFVFWKQLVRRLVVFQQELTPDQILEDFLTQVYPSRYYLVILNKIGELIQSKQLSLPLFEKAVLELIAKEKAAINRIVEDWPTEAGKDKVKGKSAPAESDDAAPGLDPGSIESSLESSTEELLPEQDHPAIDARESIADKERSTSISEKELSGEQSPKQERKPSAEKQPVKEEEPPTEEEEQFVDPVSEETAKEATKSKEFKSTESKEVKESRPEKAEEKIAAPETTSDKSSVIEELPEPQSEDAEQEIKKDQKDPHFEKLAQQSEADQSRLKKEELISKKEEPSTTDAPEDSPGTEDSTPSESDSQSIEKEQIHSSPPNLEEAIEPPIALNVDTLKTTEWQKMLDAIPEGDSFYVKNAGVILLHAFLTTYFKEFNLLGKKDFVNEAARHRAIHLIQFLATGEVGLPEYNLVLPKFLCGLPFEIPIERDIQLSDLEREEGEKLLNAAIKHWGKLGTASPAGLREGFLTRDGKLQKRANGWYLQVEQQSIDILLNYLPWGLSMVQLPWMKDLLRVEWG